MLELPSKIAETTRRVLEEERLAGLRRLGIGRVVLGLGGIALVLAFPPTVKVVYLLVGTYFGIGVGLLLLSRARSARLAGLQRLSAWAIPFVDFPTLALSLEPAPVVWVAVALCLVAASSLALSPAVILATGSVGLALVTMVALHAELSPHTFTMVGLGYMFAVVVVWLNARRLLRLALEMRRQDWLGRYRLGPRLGAGGMAEVFAATLQRDDGVSQPVAIKRILPDLAAREDIQELFRRELEISTLMRHPNIVQVLDLGVDERGMFLVMELVEGCSLARLIKHAADGGLPTDVVLLLANKIAAALDHIHTRRDDRGNPLLLMHRDLNPPNVLVTVNGEVKVSDFGIARGEATPGNTGTGRLRGKLSYAAPEQLRGQPLTVKLDLYALGLLLAEAALGRHPYQDGEDVSVERLLEGGVPDALVEGGAAPQGLVELIRWMLEADPGRRCPSAADALERLKPLRYDAEAARVWLARAVAEEIGDAPTRPM